MEKERKAFPLKSNPRPQEATQELIYLSEFYQILNYKMTISNT